MRSILIIAAATVAMGGAALAAPYVSTPTGKCQDKGNHNHFVTPSMCKAAPAAGAIMCKDGTKSAAKTRKGACSSHGGIKN